MEFYINSCSNIIFISSIASSSSELYNWHLQNYTIGVDIYKNYFSTNTVLN